MNIVDKYKEFYFTFHLHTIFSARDGCNSVSDLVKRHKELGFKRFIPTDHGTLASVLEVFKESEKQGVQGGIGIEFYMTLSNQAKEEKAKHMTAIVKSEKGFKNLLRLQYLSNTKEDLENPHFYKKPRVNEKLIYEHQEGLIFTSGCRTSIINENLIKGEKTLAYSLLHEFNAEIEDFLIELHIARNPVEESLYYDLKKFAYENNVPVIIANDAHYVTKGDLVTWNLLNSIRHVKDTNKNSISRTKTQIKNDDFYIMSYEEVYNRVYELNTYINVFISLYKNLLSLYWLDIYSLFSIIVNTFSNIYTEERLLEIQEESVSLFSEFKRLDERLSFTWEQRKLPKLIIPDAEPQLKKVLSDLLKKRFGGKAKDVPDEYLERLKKEFYIAKETNNLSYFWLTYRFLELCKRKGIMLSAGRGSAASLIICWLIGASKPDPIQYNLIIERAMNPDRPKLMDIDLDFASSEREKAYRILKELQGEENVAWIINYGYNSIKSCIQHAFRYLELPPKDADKLSKSLDQADSDDLYAFLRSTDYIRNLYKEGITDEGKKYVITPDLVIDYIRRLEGTINNYSRHASGVLVMSEPIWKHVPTYRLGDKICCAYDMGMLEELEGLKLDLLAVSVMDLIKGGLPEVLPLKNPQMKLYN